jgi:hypothetical protein
LLTLLSPSSARGLLGRFLLFFIDMLTREFINI